METSGGETDWRRELEVPEDGDPGLGSVDGGGIEDCGGATCADAEEFDLGHDEAVAAAVLAHHTVQVCEALKVQDLLRR
jgi:hypothetical protein